MSRLKVIGIEDVAKAAGVSITTVSRVINKFPSVKENNRKKVEEVIKRLKFKPNLAAQRLASGSNDLSVIAVSPPPMAVERLVSPPRPSIAETRPTSPGVPAKSAIALSRAIGSHVSSGI